jgi:hypothetical protein
MCVFANIPINFLFHNISFYLENCFINFIIQIDRIVMNFIFIFIFIFIHMMFFGMNKQYHTKMMNRAGPWGVQEALPNRASKNYGPQKKL